MFQNHQLFNILLLLLFRHFLDAVKIEDQTKPKQKHNSNAPPAIASRGYDQNRHVQYIMHFPIPYQVVLIKCMNCKDLVLTLYPLECFKVKKN